MSWTRRSVFVNVPAFSANDAPGKSTSANSAVSDGKISCTARNSPAAKLRRAWFTSGSVIARSSPKT
jgi:hypothetical protein